MEKIRTAITIETAGLLLFTILCSPGFHVPLVLLICMLLLLQAGLVWMVITILKNGTPSRHSFDEKHYEDE